MFGLLVDWLFDFFAELFVTLIDSLLHVLINQNWIYLEFFTAFSFTFVIFIFISFLNIIIFIYLFIYLFIVCFNE